MAAGGKNFGLFVVHALATVTAVAAFDAIVSAIVTVLQPLSFFFSTLLNVYIFYTSLSRTSSTGRCRGESYICDVILITQFFKLNFI